MGCVRRGAEFQRGGKDTMLFFVLRSGSIVAFVLVVGGERPTSSILGLLEGDLAGCCCGASRWVESPLSGKLLGARCSSSDESHARTRLTHAGRMLIPLGRALLINKACSSSAHGNLAFSVQLLLNFCYISG
ncbi:hypothetical protein NDU88_002245 [Pleurodeles waltl]|uniref:Uncharacterized protein n=1 Tax=Pleurodeles waltl TaxID=8319 RepID=A0AAV7UYC7_PLEWA|nr:hypothetical protein NDU88_002245 [Pleurodeles waltl]